MRIEAGIRGFLSCLFQASCGLLKYHLKHIKQQLVNRLCTETHHQVATVKIILGHQREHRFQSSLSKTPTQLMDHVSIFMAFTRLISANGLQEIAVRLFV